MDACDPGSCHLGALEKKGVFCNSGAEPSDSYNWAGTILNSGMFSQGLKTAWSHDLQDIFELVSSASQV